ncbi:MAG: histidine kinase [Bacteroidota bacterium]
MENSWRITRRPWHHHLLFWLAVFSCSVVANIEYHESWPERFVFFGFKVSLQAAVAYYCLDVVLPQYLQRVHPVRLIAQVLVLLLLLQLLAESWQCFVLEPTYPVTFADCIARYAGCSYWDRLLSPVGIFFQNPAVYFPPAVVLMAWQYLQKQRENAQLNEQKRANELQALQNQMNPHFLFNTLNNLYALAVKKSERVPEVIAKLSEILDYMLYRCRERFVPLAKEIELINNYLELERIRYGQRVDINFQHQTEAGARIAPLLLLHFVENAFKHGVSQALATSTINIHLRTTAEQTLLFRIENSIPPHRSPQQSTRTGIGLDNIKRQLKLLYPDQFQLDIQRTPDHFTVHLNLRTV